MHHVLWNSIARNGARINCQCMPLPRHAAAQVFQNAHSSRNVGQRGNVVQHAHAVCEHTRGEDRQRRIFAALQRQPAFQLSPTVNDDLFHRSPTFFEAFTLYSM